MHGQWRGYYGYDGRDKLQGGEPANFLDVGRR